MRLQGKALIQLFAGAKRAIYCFSRQTYSVDGDSSILNRRGVNDTPHQEQRFASPSLRGQACSSLNGNVGSIAACQETPPLGLCVSNVNVLELLSLRSPAYAITSPSHVPPLEVRLLSLAYDRGLDSAGGRILD